MPFLGDFPAETLYFVRAKFSSCHGAVKVDTMLQRYSWDSPLPHPFFFAMIDIGSCVGNTWFHNGKGGWEVKGLQKGW